MAHGILGRVGIPSIDLRNPIHCNLNSCVKALPPGPRSAFLLSFFANSGDDNTALAEIR